MFGDEVLRHECVNLFYCFFVSIFRQTFIDLICLFTNVDEKSREKSSCAISSIAEIFTANLLGCYSYCPWFCGFLIAGRHLDTVSSLCALHFFLSSSPDDMFTLVPLGPSIRSTRYTYWNMHLCSFLT
ncbi:hypothetical protein BpHYR1_041235 [Brachionus plicatilis]|uniref:Uncharacterized protein n=1 Tax=Brachionus plicatilis TaxID=10195 RepID=A0A3M7PLZ8_BRAPC|nr:hypothetical protein BpHYR1_041235 [Brachionus plicatilis]